MNPPQGHGQQIEFLFDFVSPYAYLAWMALRRLQRQRDLTIEAVPVLFAGLLGAHGTLGPAEVEAKRRFVSLDSRRKSAALEIPLKAPFGHPFNPLLPLRVVLATAPASADAPQSALAKGAPNRDSRLKIIDTIFRGAWEWGVEVSRWEALLPLLTEKAGLTAQEATELHRLSATGAVKQRLRENTSAAVDRGAFGVPTFFYGGELYWGVDNLPLVEAALDGRQLLEPEEDDGWRSVRPLASRALP